MIIHSLFSILLSISCYAMDTQEEPFLKRYKSSVTTNDIITALFEKFNQNPIDGVSALELIKQLVKREDVDDAFQKYNNEGNTPLLRAIHNRDFDLTKLLLNLPACRASSDTRNSQNHCTPLAIAITNHDNDFVKLLLKNGAHVNVGFLDANKEFIYPANYARSIKNFEALRLLLASGAAIEPFDTIETSDDPIKLQLTGDAKSILLENISEKYFSGFFKNDKTLDAYLDQPFQNEAQALENLMLAFAQKKITVLKNILARPGYKNILLKNDDDGRSLFSLVNHLAFDTTRVRTKFEKTEHLPIWKDQALIIGKPVSKWVIMTFKKHQKLPKDIVFLILSFVIGESLLTHMRQPKPAPM